MSRGRSWGRLRGWRRWTDIKGLGEALSRPGVYLLAHFDGAPPKVMDTKDERIIYIGETCDTLRTRWSRFNRAAFTGRGGHSGGNTYYKLFRGKHRDRLFVAFATPDDDDEVVLTHRVRYLERKWLLDYVLQNGRPPCCNSE